VTYVYQAHDLAKEAFERFKSEPNTDSRTRSIANYWGGATARIRNLAATHQDVQIKPGDEVLRGFFFSNAKKKGWSIYMVPIEARQDRTKGIAPIITYAVNPWLYSRDDMPIFESGGHNLVGEFLSGKTQRSIAAENKTLETIKSHPGTDEDAFKLESAIVTAEDWEPHADFGGSVDVIELTRRGTHWLKVKDKCKNQ
jgi:hypothetical protein